MGKNEVKLVSGFTVKSVVISVVLTIILQRLFIYATYWYVRFNKADAHSLFGFGKGASLDTFYTYAGTVYTYMFGLVALLMFALALVNSWKHILSRQEAAVIMMMVPLTLLMAGASRDCNWQGYVFDIPFGNPRLGAADQTYFYNVMPDFWGPKTAGPWSAMLMNRVMDWGLLSPLIFWSSLWGIGSCFTVIFAFMLLRHIFLNIEDLRNPLSEIYTYAVDLTQPRELSKKLAGVFKSKYFLIAFTIAFLHTLASWASGDIAAAVTGNLALRLPRTEGFLRIPGVAGTIELWPVTNIDVSATGDWYKDWLRDALVVISLMWVDVGWGLVLPVEVLAGVIVGYLCYAIVGMSLSAAYGPFAFAFPTTPPYAPNLSAVIIGLLMGLLAVPIWRNRGVMARIIKSLWKTDPELEKESPLPYRLIWGGLVVSAAVWIAMGWLTGADVGGFVGWMILIVLLALGLLRMFAESGGYIGGLLTNMQGEAISIWLALFYLYQTGLTQPQPSAPLDPTIQQMRNMYFLGGLRGFPLYFAALAVAGVWAMHCFRIAKNTTTESKGVLKALLLAVVLTSILSSIFYPLSLYDRACWTPGATGPKSVQAVHGWFTAGKSLIKAGGFSWIGAMGMVQNVWGQLGGLFIAMLAMMAFMYARGRYTWLTISAAGIILGFGNLGQYMLFPCLVCLVVKHLVLRVKGVETYQRILKPIAIGFIVGAGLAVLIEQGLYMYNQMMATIGGVP